MNKLKSYITTNRVKSVLIGLVVVMVGVTMIRSGGLFGSISWLRNSEDTGYLSNQEVDSLSFENASMEYEDGITTFKVEVYNKSSDVYSLKYISINVTDEEGKVVTLIGYIGDKLEVNEGKLITASIDQDLSNTKTIEYVVNK